MNSTKRPWIAFFSHTGKEIKDICVEFEIIPIIVCTNNPADNGMNNWCKTFHLDTKKWDSTKYRSIFETCKNPLITLHGWMKIVPADICNEYEIYNGHPALINVYPELKGKDMQEAVINNTHKYPIIGSVIHKCVAEVDAGQVLMSEHVPNPIVHNRQLIYDLLRDTSLRTWLRFLPEKLL